MEPAPSKRPVSEAFGTDDYSPPEKRNKDLIVQPGAKQKPTLLNIPREIRLLILKELLQPESPLRNRSKLHPAILRTCKTLAEDHKTYPLLYQNTFALDMWIGASDDTIKFLDHITDNFFPRTAFRNVYQRAENIAITICIDHGANTPPLTEDDSDSQRPSVALLMGPLKEFPALRNLSITVSNKHALAEDNAVGNDVLDGLKEARGLHCVDIRGVSPAHAADMKAVMESREATESLYAMLVPLREYLGEEFYEDDDWDEIRRAVGDYDVDLFRRTRERIVERVEAARAVVRRRLNQRDGLVLAFGN